jgi:hypothetical protein
VTFNIIVKDMKRLGYDTTARGVQTLSEYALQPVMSFEEPTAPDVQVEQVKQLVFPYFNSMEIQAEPAGNSSDADKSASQQRRVSDDKTGQMGSAGARLLHAIGQADDGWSICIGV